MNAYVYLVIVGVLGHLIQHAMTLHWSKKLLKMTPVIQGKGKKGRQQAHLTPKQLRKHIKQVRPLLKARPMRITVNLRRPKSQKK